MTSLVAGPGDTDVSAATEQDYRKSYEDVTNLSVRLLVDCAG